MREFFPKKNHGNFFDNAKCGLKGDLIGVKRNLKFRCEKKKNIAGFLNKRMF